MLKVMVRLLAGLVLVAAAYVALLLLIPGDIVTSRYASAMEARADQLFARGWLPDILPPSSHDIRTSNNLDVNTSEGEFSFAPSEYTQFAARVGPGPLLDKDPHATSENRILKMRNNGHTVSTYTEANSTWVFFCKPESGHCKYEMWLHGG
jgi:hypothetical protein